MANQDKCYVLCVEYISQSGAKVVGRSKPTTRKAAYRSKRARLALNKDVKCWVEKKPFELTNG